MQDISETGNVVAYMAKKVIPNGSKNTLIVTDNLYSSVLLAAYLRSQGHHFLGTARTSSKGWPAQCTQAALAGERARQAKGTIIQARAVSCGDGSPLPPGAKDVLAMSVYDSAPCNHITTYHDKARIVKV
jgi:hypothetical protein